ncbi:MAG: Tat pathway signal protein [Pseudomonadota bacterium]
MSMTRRGFMISAASLPALRLSPSLAPSLAKRPKIILELVYDKGLGMMRAVERVIW